MAVILNGTFEVDNQFHVNWFSTTTARSTADFNTGAASLRVESTASFGSGVTLGNYPYFPITAGNSYDFSCFHRYSVNPTGQVVWNHDWRTEAGALVLNQQTLFTPTTSWTGTGVITRTAPVTATRLGWSFTFSVNPAGPILWLDDVLVEDTPPSARNWRRESGQDARRASLVRGSFW